MNDPSPRRLYEEVALKLTERINYGELADGSLLPSERKLMEMFGVSRTAVREALVSLQAAGLISVRPSRRAVVTRLNNAGFFNQLTGAVQSLMARPNGMSDFQEARALFEYGLARHAARYASPKEIAKLRAALEQNRRAVGDPELFAKTGLEFHKILAEIPRNGIFMACQSAIAEWMAIRRTFSSRSRTPQMSKAVLERREAVYQAIAARDVEAAEKAMSAHLDLVNEIYRKGQEATKTKQ